MSHTELPGAPESLLARPRLPAVDQVDTAWGEADLSPSAAVNPSVELTSAAHVLGQAVVLMPRPGASAEPANL